MLECVKFSKSTIYSPVYVVAVLWCHKVQPIYRYALAPTIHTKIIRCISVWTEAQYRAAQLQNLKVYF